MLDAAAEVERIVEALRRQVFVELGRRGAVVGLSGGIDSSVVAALCVRAFGNRKVLGVFMPEHHSSDDSLRLGRSCADQLGINTVLALACAPVRGVRRLSPADRSDPDRGSRI